MERNNLFAEILAKMSPEQKQALASASLNPGYAPPIQVGRSVPNLMPTVEADKVSRQQQEMDWRQDQLSGPLAGGLNQWAPLAGVIKGIASNMQRGQDNETLEALYGKVKAADDERQAIEAQKAQEKLAAEERAAAVERARKAAEEQALYERGRRDKKADAAEAEKRATEKLYREKPWLRETQGSGVGADGRTDTRFGGRSLDEVQRMGEEGAQAYGVLPMKDSIAEESGLRDDYRKDSETFAALDSTLANINELASQATPASDAALIGAINKILDPTSATTDAERSAYAGLGGALDKVAGLKESIASGKLLPGIREQIVDIASGIYSQQLPIYDKTRQRHAQTAGNLANQGVRIEQVVGEDYATQRGALSQPGVPTINTEEEFSALPSGATYIDAEDGKTYRKP